MKKYFLILLVIIGSNMGFAQSTRSLIIGTYNLRYNNTGDKDNAWTYRKDNVKALVQFHGFDIFGTQEGYTDQLNDLLEMKEYSYVGVGRDDGKDAGEHSAIFYRNDRFRILDSGNFWLSETPNIPGKGWDAKCCNRLCSWAKFQDFNSKKEFYFFNVHFDHEGAVARRESAKLMLKQIHKIAGKGIVICTGDFNAVPTDEPIQIMSKDLHDSKTICQTTPYGPDGTYNDFDYNSELTNRIDYIFVNDRVGILKYGVLSDSKNRKFFSDHLPVMVKAYFIE